MKFAVLVELESSSDCDSLSLDSGDLEPLVVLLVFLFLRHPPPTGTFLRAPPLVQ